jgi:hypothetical protein
VIIRGAIVMKIEVLLSFLPLGSRAHYSEWMRKRKRRTKKRERGL